MTKIILDSEMSFSDAVAQTSAPWEVIETLSLLSVDYYSFDGMIHRGQLVLHRELISDVREIFSRAIAIKFPIGQCVPIVAYGWDDETSMKANNTSAFNYRLVAGTNRLSLHALGRAIDINPLLNPAVYDDGRISPEGAVYEAGRNGVLSPDYPPCQDFLGLGWRWGADLDGLRDYHHFYKTPLGNSIYPLCRG
ncbi:MAG: M15 family metallopeptidase [Smithellaceae bacterium]|nr:M15 family metallopeptidase [Smithellaceae bacterium]